MSLRDRRVTYEGRGLEREDLGDDPVDVWNRWYGEAAEAGLSEPNAVVLSTVDPQGAPDARVVLVRRADANGLVIYTNRNSAKGRQLALSPRASGVSAWLEMNRQVRFRGRIELASDDESDAYFFSRPRDHQLGAWTSPQSEVIESRAVLDALRSEVETRFAGVDVPRPPFWGGFVLIPEEWEFWQGRPSRLHDRFRYRRSDPGGSWIVERLAP